MSAARDPLKDAQFYLEEGATLAATGAEGVEAADHLFGAAAAAALVSLAGDLREIQGDLREIQGCVTDLVRGNSHIAVQTT